MIESRCQLPCFVATCQVNARIPMPRGNVTCAFGQFLNRPRDARRNPPREQQSNQHRRGGDHRGNLHDVPRQEHQITARTSHQQRAEQFSVAPGQRKDMENFSGGGVLVPLNRLHQRRWLLLDFLDDRREPLGLIHSSGGAGNVAGYKRRIKVEVKQGAHSSGRNQRCEEILVQSPAADRIERLRDIGLRSNRGQRHRNFIRQFFPPQECFRPIPILAARHPRLFVPDPRRILRRGNQRAVRDHKFHEV